MIMQQQGLINPGEPLQKTQTDAYMHQPEPIRYMNKTCHNQPSKPFIIRKQALLLVYEVLCFLYTVADCYLVSINRELLKISSWAVKVRNAFGFFLHNVYLYLRGFSLRVL